MRYALKALLLATLFASACSSGSATGSASTSVDAQGAEPAVSPQPAAPDDADDTSVAQADSVAGGATSMAASSPIGAAFADDGGFEAALAEYRLQVRETILVCMAEQGFEFAVTEGATRNEVNDRQNDLTLREWTTEFGFGISTSFGSIAQSQATNPNAAIVRSLGEAERELWALTLNGVGLAGLAGGGNQVSNTRPLEEQGCIGQAIIATGGQDAVEGLGDFGAVYDEGEAALLERREVIEVVALWSRCMGAEGFIEFAALDDPEDEVRTQFAAITAPIRPRSLSSATKRVKRCCQANRSTSTSFLVSMSTPFETYRTTSESSLLQILTAMRPRSRRCTSRCETSSKISYSTSLRLSSQQ